MSCARRAAARGVVLAACLLGLVARAEPVIVLDPGHGGSQEGAVGPDGRVKEKEVCLQLALRLASLLEAQGAKVVLTRRKDRLSPLAERVELANRVKPDLFVSLHANSMPTSKLRARNEGIETFFLSASASGEEARQTADRENAEGAGARVVRRRDTLSFILADLQRAEAHAESSQLAYAVHQRLIKATGAVDRGVQQAPFYVLAGVDVPGILVEVGFLSHPVEGRRLADATYQGKLAAAMTQGIQVFLQQLRQKDAREPAAAR